MAIRVRADGRMLCAAMHPLEDGDVYIPDGLHYELSAKRKVLVTQRHEDHAIRGEWWLRNQVPVGIEIDNFYTEDETC